MQLALHQPNTSQLSSLCKLGEKILPGSAISIYELIPRSRLLQRAGPSIPRMMRPVFQEIPIGRNVGSCGTAAWTGRPIRVDDIANDSRWDAYRTLPLRSGFRGCWSQPIRAFDETVVGTVGFYFRSAPKSERATSEALRHISDVAAQVLNRAGIDEGFRDHLISANAHIEEAVESLGLKLFSANQNAVNTGEPPDREIHMAHLLCRLSSDALQVGSKEIGIPLSGIVLAVAQELGKQARVALHLEQTTVGDRSVGGPEAFHRLLFWSGVWVARGLSSGTTVASVTLIDASTEDHTSIELEAQRTEGITSRCAQVEHLLSALLVGMATRSGWTLTFSERRGRRFLSLTDA